MDEFVEARIPRRLRPFVASMVGYRITGAAPGTHVGMPSGTITVVLALDEPLDLVRADGRRGHFDTVLAGLHAAPALIHHAGSQHGIQLGLSPVGASVLLGGPAGVVAGTSVDLEAVLGPRARRLHERLSECPRWVDRFALVTDALFADVEPRWSPRPEVAHAWRLLQGSCGRLPVREIAREVGWSPRHLGECFRAEYGHSPKTTARVLRFQESHRLVSAGVALGTVAADCGFSDQSHLDREWRSFAGAPPTHWLRDDSLAGTAQTAAP